VPEIPRREHRITIAVDPGVNGGLVCIHCDGTIEPTPMPQTDRDVWSWFDKMIIVNPAVGKFAVIEKVASSPQMGVVSAFTFGQGYGFLKGCLTAIGIPFEEVRPQVWQKFLGIPPRVQGKKTKVLNKRGKMVTRRVGGESDTQWKQRLRAKAQQLYPSLPLWEDPKSIGRQLAVSDALLIAQFARRLHQ
jgi:hypothetical protein